MMSYLQKISSVARGTGAALANSSMYIGQTIGSAVAGVLFVAFDNFIFIGVFTAILYVVSLLVFRKSDRYMTGEIGEKQKTALYNQQ
ncbi:multidrug transporter [Bacillus pseudomycoides]|uniref:MFS transporter n=1 Tax=Bacillus pseudomycoides TaxID=64104 RepID=A0AAJ3RFG6_9BACI|nr:putative multidrug resistance protein B [Bacillus pseudomycoides]MBD5800240.1 multidrug transporter [Bacillus pseudomycoides]MDR4189351.1 MFS transporter [Bacillus pseudomycoides]MDR4327223.1 MFS transporter [Bacillus pseudomycoides]PDZ09586.1 multidrug transporter [Bacillus pseudomycoides]